MGKTILKTAGITLAACITLIVVVGGIIFACSPIAYARLFDDMGKSDSLYFYEKNYQKNSDINNLYLLLDKSIKYKDNDKIIKYYEILHTDAECDEFLAFVNENNYKVSNTVLQNVMLYNEDNRLKSRYAAALANKNRLADACTFAITDLSCEDNFVIASLAGFIKEGTLDDNVYVQVYNNYLTTKAVFGGLGVSDNFVRAVTMYKMINMLQFLIATYQYNHSAGFISKADLEGERNANSLIFNALIA